MLLNRPRSRPGPIGPRDREHQTFEPPNGRGRIISDSAIHFYASRQRSSASARTLAVVAVRLLKKKPCVLFLWSFATFSAATTLAADLGDPDADWAGKETVLSQSINVYRHDSKRNEVGKWRLYLAARAGGVLLNDFPDPRGSDCIDRAFEAYKEMRENSPSPNYLSAYLLPRLEKCGVVIDPRLSEEQIEIRVKSGLGATITDRVGQAISERLHELQYTPSVRIIFRESDDTSINTRYYSNEEIGSLRSLISKGKEWAKTASQERIAISKKLGSVNVNLPAQSLVLQFLSEDSGGRSGIILEQPTAPLGGSRYLVETFYVPASELIRFDELLVKAVELAGELVDSRTKDKEAYDNRSALFK